MSEPAIDLDALESIAHRANQGHWSVHEGYCCFGIATDQPRGLLVAEDVQPHQRPPDPNDLAHMAAFDPPACLALLARLRRAETILRSAANGYPDETGLGTYYSHSRLRDDARAYFAAQEAADADR